MQQAQAQLQETYRFTKLARCGISILGPIPYNYENRIPVQPNLTSFFQSLGFTADEQEKAYEFHQNSADSYECRVVIDGEIVGKGTGGNRVAARKSAEISSFRALANHPFYMRHTPLFHFLQ